jgi:hypothetical protein
LEDTSISEGNTFSNIFEGNAKKFFDCTSEENTEKDFYCISEGNIKNPKSISEENTTGLGVYFKRKHCKAWNIFFHEFR